jgi:hypothetical protein
MKKRSLMQPRQTPLWPMPGPRLLGFALVVILVAALRLWTCSPDRPGGSASPELGTLEQAVLIHFRLSDGAFGTPEEVTQLMDLEQRLETAIESSGAGELDGNEVGGGEFVVFIYGPDADRLFAVVEPLLRESPLASGGFAVKRYGAADDPGAREARVELGTPERR